MIRYKFFNLEHLLLYINNIQIQLNINTQKLQSFLIIRKTTKKQRTRATQFEIYPMTNRTDHYNKWTSL
jgi:hypothetical protein